MAPWLTFTYTQTHNTCTHTDMHGWTCVEAYTCKYIHTYACMGICGDTHMQAHTHMHAWTCVDIYMDLHIYMQVYTYTYACMAVYGDIYMQVHMHTYACMNMHGDTHRCTLASPGSEMA